MKGMILRVVVGLFTFTLGVLIPALFLMRSHASIPHSQSNPECSVVLDSHATQGESIEPEKVSLCRLKDDPAKYNHRLVEIAGFVSHGFEDFTISDPSCPSWPAVWLEYGGTASSNTMYCCGVTPSHTRAKQLVVEKIPIPLVDNEQFREFDQLLQRRPDSVVHATIVGTFFAGEQVTYPKGTYWGGYGHMGCCSLLAIQQVKSVDQQDREDLDYRASTDQPKLNKAGCGYKFLTDIESTNEIIQFQKRADSGEREWSFDDPQRVASEGLARLLKTEETWIAGMKEIRRAQGRIVYQWRPRPNGKSYMVVVSRPYLLSYYAEDAKRVAWVIRAAYESSCGPGNSVTRVR
jgi:hypothetical protein